MARAISTLPLFACIVLLTPLRAVAQQAQPPGTGPQPPLYWGPGPWHMWGDGYGWHFLWMGPLMMLFVVLVCAALIYVLFARGPWGGGPHHAGSPWHMGDRMWSPPTHTALQILNERFARGEIQKDEYQDKKATILSGGQHQV